MGRKSVTVVSVGVLSMLIVACGDSARYCDCVRFIGELRVQVAAGSVLDPALVHASGAGCNVDQPPTVSPYADGLYVPLTGAGNCHIEITDRGGTTVFTADRRVSYEGDPGCCGAFRADPIVLPRLDLNAPIGVADAGAR